MKLVFDNNVFFYNALDKEKKLNEKVYELSFKAFDPCEDNTGKPEINLHIELIINNANYISIYLQDAQQIDALRRYCEMALAHHEKELIYN